jgi:hypothetical protein
VNDNAGIDPGPLAGLVLEVSATQDDPDWQILQSPFMRDHARTTPFYHVIDVQGDRLAYFETTFVDIYRKVFEHTDQNVLSRQ